MRVKAHIEVAATVDKSNYVRAKEGLQKHLDTHAPGHKVKLKFKTEGYPIYEIHKGGKHTHSIVHSWDHSKRALLNVATGEMSRHENIYNAVYKVSGYKKPRRKSKKG